MINRLQKKYALSVQGAKDLFKAIVYSVLANISLMLPVALLAIVLNTMLPMALGMEEKVAGFAGYTVVRKSLLLKKGVVSKQETRYNRGQKMDGGIQNE